MNWGKRQLLLGGPLNLLAQEWQPHQLVPSGKVTEQLSGGQTFGWQSSPVYPSGQTHALPFHRVFGAVHTMQLPLLSK